MTVSMKMVLKGSPHSEKVLVWFCVSMFWPPTTCQSYFAVLPASIPLPMSRNDSIEVLNQKRLLRTLEQLTNRLKRTLAKQPLSSFHVSSEMIVADPRSLESRKASLYCRPGSVLKGRMCGKIFTLMYWHKFLLITWKMLFHASFSTRKLDCAP